MKSVIVPEKPIEFLRGEVSSDILYGIGECYVVSWVTVVLKPRLKSAPL